MRGRSGLRWGDRDGMKTAPIVIRVVVDHKTEGFKVGVFEIEEDLFE